MATFRRHIRRIAIYSEMEDLTEGRKNSWDRGAYPEKELKEKIDIDKIDMEEIVNDTDMDDDDDCDCDDDCTDCQCG